MDARIKYSSVLLLAVLLFACNGNAPKQAIPTATAAVDQQVPVTNTIATDSTASIEQKPAAVKEKTLVFEAYREPEGVDISIPDIRITSNKKPAYQTPSKHIYLQLTDTTAQNRVYIFYYSPRMKNKAYNYQQHLGSDNNFLSIPDRNGRDIVAIPDTIEPGAQLLFRSIGYEPCSVAVDELNENDLNTIPLTPKIYTSTIVLNEVNKKITASIIHEKTTDTTFYGECNPIYFDDGNHGDPICAFSCLACCYPHVYCNTLQAIVTTNQDGVRKLYKALKKGKSCSLLLFSARAKASVEIEQQPDKENSFLQALTAAEWSIRSDDGIYFQQRFIFVAKE